MKILKSLAFAGILGAAAFSAAALTANDAQAFWGWGDGSGNGDMSFSMRFSGRGNAHGNGYGYGRPAPYYYGPPAPGYGYPYPPHAGPAVYPRPTAEASETPAVN